MVTKTRWETHRARPVSRGAARFTGLLLLPFLTALLFPAGIASAQGGDLSTGQYCSATATAAFNACLSDVQDTYLTTRGICINVSDAAERSACVADADATRVEDSQLCQKQLAARRAVCQSLGEGRYDPDFDPALFDNPLVTPVNPNPYFPLGIGDRWVYRSRTQTTAVKVLNETKLIEGVTCVVVSDRVTEGGTIIEDTNDWFAPAKTGDVYYCGEETGEFETFAGDHPRRPELVSIDGSFKAGRDGDKPGIVFRGSPTPGEIYRQEFSLGNAEDVAVVLSTTYAFGQNARLDQLVPPRLAKLLCAGDCVVTKEFTPLGPGEFERKYYAPGVGLFLEVAPGTGEVVRLVGCNVDPRCAALPTP